MFQKLTHWKVPGKEELQGNWIKAFKSLRDQILNFQNVSLQSVKSQTGWLVEDFTH